jgi:peptidoglycan hydrolase FlgJ
MTIPTTAAASDPGAPVAVVARNGRSAPPTFATTLAAATASSDPGTTASVSNAATSNGTAVPAAIKNAAENFESFFLSQSLESMFAGVDTNALFGGGPGEKIYRSMLLQQYGKIVAQSGGLGIGDAVQRELLNAQEVK